MKSLFTPEITLALACPNSELESLESKQQAGWRTRDLLRAGVMTEKPLWYDVYAAFPPLREPVFRRVRQRYGKAKALVPEILYQEDRIRAKFYSAYGSGPRAFELFNSNFKSTSQRFVEKYTELQNLGETDEEKLFGETGKALLAEGITLRRKDGAAGGGQKAAQKPMLTSLKLKALLDESQSQQGAQQEQHLESAEEQQKNLSPH
uniref:Small ribosomal subunit protein mS23 n=1 Tax=Ornithorhynchus anatinus TaxID=9258 RepID=A0A6I8NKX2_ORNAN